MSDTYKYLENIFTGSDDILDVINDAIVIAEKACVSSSHPMTDRVRSLTCLNIIEKIKDCNVAVLIFFYSLIQSRDVYVCFCTNLTPTEHRSVDQFLNSGTLHLHQCLNKLSATKTCDVKVETKRHFYDMRMTLKRLWSA